MPDVIVYRTMDCDHQHVAPQVVNRTPLDSIDDGVFVAISQPEGGKFFITDRATQSIVVYVEPVDRVIPPFNPKDATGKSLSGHSNVIPFLGGFYG